MRGTWDLKEGGEYAIKYSPGIIFSNTVPALDVDFITTEKDSYEEVKVSIVDVSSKEEMKKLIDKVKSDSATLNSRVEVCQLPYKSSIMTGIGVETESAPVITSEMESNAAECGLEPKVEIVAGMSGYTTAMVNYSLKYPNESYEYTYYKSNNGKTLGIIDKGDGTEDVQELMVDKECDYVTFHVYRSQLYQREPIKQNNENGYPETVAYAVYKYDLNNLSDSVETIQNKYISGQLKENIAKWYVALRTLALVGLLSVLLYIGIRILLSSSSANDKAKYKNMIKDWLIAICIIFVLHYIMTFMITIIDHLNEMISANVLETTTLPATTVEGNRIDKLMSKVRTNVGDAKIGNGGLETAGYTIMYLTLVILTGVYTFQYLKRVVYLAFLTMIAPLIALTYPLDKIKDSKAQAFTFWLREYIVNCLIQPVHLLLYTVFVSNAIEFATENILYSLVALAFMVPAEKIIKQMFGLKSDSPVNTLTAAAGGAMVMNMLNKIKGGGSKGGKSGSDAGSGGSSNPSGVRTATRNAGGAGNTGDGGAGSGGMAPLDSGSGSVAGGSSNGGSGSSVGGRHSVGAGLGALGLGAIKGVGKGVISAAGGLAGGTIGLAAAVADGGDGLGTKVVGGALAGTYLAGHATTIPGKLKGMHPFANIADTYRKAALDEETYNNQKFDKAFYKSDGYKKILSSSDIKSRYSTPEAIQAQTQMFLDNGITDPKAIQTALEAGVDGDEYKQLSNMGISDVKKYSKLKTSKNLSSSAIASRMAIAKNMPGELYGNEIAFIRYAGRYGISENEAKDLFNDINDYV